MRLVEVGDIVLDVQERGGGAPVVFVQTALTADELAPLAAHLSSRGAYRTVVYHRRGYGGSSPGQQSGSVTRDAVDCRELIGVLGLGSAHVVGYSYSGAVCLQLAADAPEHVRTLTLIEPPPVHVPSAAEFRAANRALLEAREARGAGAALEDFLSQVVGPHWRVEVERALTGAVEQMQRDAATFFDVDLPALLAWQYDADSAGRIGCPVLHIGGTRSGPLFAEVRDLMLRWLPHAEDAQVTGADHSLTLTHTAQLADLLHGFLSRHPVQAPSRNWL